MLKRVNIQVRLGIGYALLTLLVLLVALMSIRALGTAQANFENEVARLERLQGLGNDVLDAANARAVAARNLVLSSDAAQADIELAAIRNSHRKIQELLTSLQAATDSTVGATPALKQGLARVLKTESVYGPVALEITRMAAAGNREAAIASINKDCRPLLVELIRELNVFIEETRQIGRANVAVSRADFSRMRTGMVIVGAVAAAVAVVLGLLTTRSIVQPLAQATAASEEFAAGNLSHRLVVQGRDEIARMLGAMETMRCNLAAIVAKVRAGADGVAAASLQIVQRNQDLSGRTGTQASALQQTAQSMEQLNTTVRQNADHAEQANQLARSASAVATQGGQVVSQVVETMRGIDGSSKRIADIIAVIDGIAFQTNILALNAAVEAARAGEQGRGFAVVANEVRSLAQRSAAAAKEIKTLINDSVTRVSQGAALADQAGRTMQEIVTGIQRVTDIMGEISAASGAQSSSIAQVNVAVMAQMDQATQQNAALVQDMAGAAESMSSQAQELVQSVAVFKLT